MTDPVGKFLFGACLSLSATPHYLLPTRSVLPGEGEDWVGKLWKQLHAKRNRNKLLRYGFYARDFDIVNSDAHSAELKEACRLLHDQLVGPDDLLAYHPPVLGVAGRLVRYKFVVAGLLSGV